MSTTAVSRPSRRTIALAGAFGALASSDRDLPLGHGLFRIRLAAFAYAVAARLPSRSSSPTATLSFR
jgi:hypothetical protein